MNYQGLKRIQKVHELLERVTVVQSAKTGVQESAEKLTEMRTIFESVTSPSAELALAQECCFGSWAADIWSAYTQYISFVFPAGQDE